MKRKKLDLKDLELQLPPIESKESKIILGGSSYGWTITDGIELDEIVIIANNNEHPNQEDYGDYQDDSTYDYQDDGYDEHYEDHPGDFNNDGLSENEWIAWNGAIDAARAYYNAQMAIEAVQGMPGLHNGFGDAARHAYWMALNAGDLGANDARDLGVAHENDGSNNAQETEMDLNNNDWGINFNENWSGDEDWTFEDFMDAFWDAVQNGDIIIIDQDSIPDENIWGN